MHASIFREYDIRGIYNNTLNDLDAHAIGMAFARRVMAHIGKPGIIAVGYDGRHSSPALSRALMEGIVSTGCDVLDIGLGPTPMLYYAACTQSTAGGIMVTGSHNPANHNGFKFMLGGKPFFGEAIQQLRSSIMEEGAPPNVAPASVQLRDVREAYVAELMKAYSGAKSLRIGWDAGNGATGEIMTMLAEHLPGMHVLLNEAIDGSFPAHHPDPTVPENLAQLIEAVRANTLDVGIAFDGDGDRIGVVDDEGEILWGDQLLMLYARDVLAKQPGATIIADVKASQTLFDEIKRLGGKALMWKTGHSHIKAKMAELKAPLAGEMSGHIFFADRYFGYDDALYAAVRLLAWLAAQDAPLSAIRKRLPQAVATPEWRFDCADERKFTVIEEVAARLQAAGADYSAVDGVRVNKNGGWWLLRASNTQPMLSARCEAPDELSLQRLKFELSEQLALSNVRLPF